MSFDPVVIGIALCAAFVVGLAKSGLVPSLGAAGVPILVLVMPPRDAAGMMLPILMAMDAVALVNLRHHVDWRHLQVLLPGAVGGIALGALTSSLVSDAAIELGVGLISLLFVAASAMPKKRPASQNASTLWGLFWGGVAGVTSFISHTGGPPFQIYMLPKRLAPALYAGTSAWFFAIVNAVKLGPYFLLGQLSTRNLEMSLYGLPAAFAGIALGLVLVRRVPATLFYRAAYVLILLLGIKLVWDGATGLWS